MDNTREGLYLSEEARYALTVYKEVTACFEAYQEFRINSRKRYYNIDPPASVVLELHELFFAYAEKFVAFNESMQDIADDTECAAMYQLHRTYLMKPYVLHRNYVL